MTKVQFDEMLSLLKSINESILALSVMLSAPQPQQRVTSVREAARKNISFKMDYKPSPLSSLRGATTTTQALEQILMHSDLLDREKWEALKGLKFDDGSSGDMYEGYSEPDDTFEQSKFASYYEPKPLKVEMPDVGTKSMISAAVAHNEPFTAAQGATNNSADEGGEGA